MKKYILLVAVFLAGSVANSQEKDSKFKTIEIKTSAQCEQCKKRMEEFLAFEPGVKKSTLDLETKAVTVEYNKDKTSPEKIRKAITKCGYDADDQLADPKAYKKLPACCKKPDDPGYMEHGKK